MSVARVRGTSCRFLTKSGRLTSGRRCRRPVLLSARGTRSWRFTARVRRAGLPAGRYRLVVRAVDRKRNKERPSRRNSRRFTVR